MMGLKTKLRGEIWNMVLIRDDRRDEGETGDYEDGYADGLQWALDEVKKEWAFLEAMETDAGEHEVTLKEVKEFCTKQKEEADVDEDPCDYCPMAEKYSCSDGISFMQCGQIADILPCDWDIVSIQKHMKDARK